MNRRPLLWMDCATHWQRIADKHGRLSSDNCRREPYYQIELFHCTIEAGLPGLRRSVVELNSACWRAFNRRQPLE